MFRSLVSSAVIPAVLLSACMADDRPAADTTDNPFFSASELPLRMPAFDRIRNEHFAPAFERGMTEEIAEVERIASSTEPPTFENTLVALERSGRLLRRVRTVFNNLTSAHTNDTLEALRTEFAPKFSAHVDRIRLDPALFARIESVYERRDELGLSGEDRRLVERYRTDFVRAGAMLTEEEKERLGLGLVQPQREEPAAGPQEIADGRGLRGERRGSAGGRDQDALGRK